VSYDATGQRSSSTLSRRTVAITTAAKGVQRLAGYTHRAQIQPGAASTPTPPQQTEGSPCGGRPLIGHRATQGPTNVPGGRRPRVTTHFPRPRNGQSGPRRGSPSLAKPAPSGSTSPANRSTIERGRWRVTGRWIRVHRRPRRAHAPAAIKRPVAFQFTTLELTGVPSVTHSQEGRVSRCEYPPNPPLWPRIPGCASCSSNSAPNSRCSGFAYSSAAAMSCTPVRARCLSST
jgi:hypothetical protein